MKSLKCFGVMLFLFPTFSWAALIELKGNGAAFDSNIVWLTNFTVGYLIDTDIVDSNPDLKEGAFNGALKSGFLIFRSSRYELDLFSGSCNGSVNTTDYSDAFVARGVLNFGSCHFINSSGDVLQYSSGFRSYTTDNFSNAGISLHGLEAIPVYFESDGDLSFDDMGHYANIHIRTFVPETRSITLMLLGLLSLVGVRLVKARSV